MTNTTWAIGDKLEIINAKGISGYKSYELKNGMVCTVKQVEREGHLWISVPYKNRQALILPSEFEVLRKVEPEPDFKTLYENALKELHELKNPDTRLTFDEKGELAESIVEDFKKEFREQIYWDAMNITFDESTISRWVITTLLNHATGEVSVGKAKCSYNDRFDLNIGSAISLLRALGRPIPSKFMEGTKPDANS